MTHHTAIPAVSPGHADQATLTDRLGGILAPPALPGASCARRHNGTPLHDPELWFATGDGTGRTSTRTALEAIKICQWCPARQACLAYALTHDPLAGIWGGMTEGQRDKLRGKGAAA